MAEISEVVLRDRVERRRAGLENSRKREESWWKECSGEFMPRKSLWLFGNGPMPDPSTQGKNSSKAMNGKPIRANARCANGMADGMHAPSRPWFKLSTMDPDLAQFGSVKLWLALAQNRLEALFARSNYYRAAHAGDKQLTTFGIDAGIIEQSPTNDACIYPLQAGEYWMANGAELEVDTLYRRVPMTVAQVVQEFGNKASATTRKLYDRSDYDTVVPVYHAIEPNPERIPDAVDKSNMLYRSVYWEDASPDKTILEFGGYKIKPFWGARWESEPGSAYSATWPCLDALGDAKLLRLKELRLQQHQDYLNRPPLNGPPQAAQSFHNLGPGGLSFTATTDAFAMKPVWEVRNAIEDFLADIQRLEGSIEEFFFTDLWMAISQMQGVQPRNAEEISERVGEKMTMLGPVVEAIQNEKLRPAIDIGFHILTSSGALPPAPPELHGQPLKVEFTSTLAQLQRAAGLTAIERMTGYLGNLAGSIPEALDRFDADEAVKKYGELTGVWPTIIRDDPAVAKLRAMKAQAAQAQAAAQMAQPAAQAATAAQTLAATPTGAGRNALEQMIGQAA